MAEETLPKLTEEEIRRLDEDETEKLKELFNLNRGIYDDIIIEHERISSRIFKLFPLFTFSVPIVFFIFKWIIEISGTISNYSPLNFMRYSIIITGVSTLVCMINVIFRLKFGLIIIKKVEINNYRQATLNQFYDNLIDNYIDANEKNFGKANSQYMRVLVTFTTFLIYVISIIIAFIFYLGYYKEHLPKTATYCIF